MNSFGQDADKSEDENYTGSDYINHVVISWSKPVGQDFGEGSVGNLIAELLSFVVVDQPLDQKSAPDIHPGGDSHNPAFLYDWEIDQIILDHQR